MKEGLEFMPPEDLTEKILPFHNFLPSVQAYHINLSFVFGSHFLLSHAFRGLFHNFLNQNVLQGDTGTTFECVETG